MSYMLLKVCTILSEYFLENRYIYLKNGYVFIILKQKNENKPQSTFQGLSNIDMVNYEYPHEDTSAFPLVFEFLSRIYQQILQNIFVHIQSLRFEDDSRYTRSKNMKC